MTALELDEELSGLELLSPELKEKAGYNERDCSLVPEGRKRRKVFQTESTKRNTG